MTIYSLFRKQSNATDKSFYETNDVKNFIVSKHQSFNYWPEQSFWFRCIWSIKL